MIAIDAMGGDNAPQAIVQGALVAAQNGIPILLCGDPVVLEPLLSLLASNWRSLPITVEPCSQVITMNDDPRWAVVRKTDSSLIRAMQAVVSGRAQAFLSAGNSGAVFVASIMLSGRVPGIQRPAIGSFLPTRRGSVFCLDLGANTDCSAEMLYHFALMGHAYAQIVLKVMQPRIGLLSNGHEPYKGAAAVKKAYGLLEGSTLNFVGNVEARDIFDDKADVLVSDGFVGNVMLKTVQGTAKALFTWLKDESQRQWWIHKILLWLNEGVFKAIKKRTDYATVGGALLLGVNHPIILAHGSSDSKAIANALMFARDIIQDERLVRFNHMLQMSLHENAVDLSAAKESFENHLH